MTRIALILMLLLAVGSARSLAQGLERGIGHAGSREDYSPANALPSLISAASDKLVEADGTLSWKVLGRISIVRHENTDNRFGRGVAYFAEPVVADEVKALVGKKVKVKGYALPRQAEAGSVRFLVSALPAADADGCTNGGRETFVDIVMPGAGAPKMDTLVVVEGILTLFDMNRWGGYIYRLSEPRVVESFATARSQG